MSTTETTVYPTDLLMAKYRTVLEASVICKCSIPTILEAIESKAIPYAEFKVEGKRRRVVHVNPEDLSLYLSSRKTGIKKDA